MLEGVTVGDEVISERGSVASVKSEKAVSVDEML
jgi:hypothetical protein